MTGRPDVHGFLGEIEGRLEGTREAGPMMRTFRGLALVRLLGPPEPPAATHWTMDATTLADSSVDVFLQNYRMIGALAAGWALPRSSSGLRPPE